VCGLICVVLFVYALVRPKNDPLQPKDVTAEKEPLLNKDDIINDSAPLDLDDPATMRSASDA